MKRLTLVLLLAGCTSIEPREALTTWKTPCSNGLQTVVVRYVDSPTPTLDCIRGAPPAAAAELVALTLFGFPPMACVLSQAGTVTVYVNMNLGKISDEQIQHELEHQWGMQHPAMLPFVQSCWTEQEKP